MNKAKEIIDLLVEKKQVAKKEICLGCKKERKKMYTVEYKGKILTACQWCRSDKSKLAIIAASS